MDVFYELTPKVDLSVGYTYTDTTVDAINPGTRGPLFVSSYDQASHFLNVGARGNLMPKLNRVFQGGLPGER